MIVRRARYSDAAQVAELLLQLGSTPPVDADEALRRLARARETVFVADDDGQLQGLVAVKTDLYFGHARPLTHLVALVARAGARRSGVGRALVERAIAFARVNESTGIELTCGLNTAREAAHEFYPSMGFLRTAYRYWLPLDPDARPTEEGMKGTPA